MTVERCLFCGKPEKEQWEEYTRYYYCDCKGREEYMAWDDSVSCLKEEYQLKLAELKKLKPKEKYFIRHGMVYKIKETTK